jgi:hypothetical protein
MVSSNSDDPFGKPHQTLSHLKYEYLLQLMHWHQMTYKTNNCCKASVVRHFTLKIRYMLLFYSNLKITVFTVFAI